MSPHSRQLTSAADTAFLQSQLAVREQQLADLRASNSWRLTAPLRWLTQLAQRLRRMMSAKTIYIPADSEVKRDYAEWIRHFDSPNVEVSANLHAQVAGLAELPLFSILLPCLSPKLVDLEATIDSVRQQIYPNWELCVAVVNEVDGDVRALLARTSRAEPRIKVSFVASAGSLAALTNHALHMVSSEAHNPSLWVLRLNATDLIANSAIYSPAKVINEHKNCQIIYADEDVLDAAGQRSEPYFKCDWNPDLHESHNLIGRFGLYATALARAVGGYGVDSDEVMDFDLSLRCVERVQAEHIRHVPQVLFHARLHTQVQVPAQGLAVTERATLSAAGRATDAGKLALDAHFRRQGILAKSENLGYGYRTRYALPTVFPILPLVSLIIPTRNGLALLRQCIDSIVQKTTYSRYEIVIVDNGSDDPATLDYFKTLAEAENIQILRIDAPFNYSALNNTAVKAAKGELIGLINNDIEVITPDWLGELVSHALRPGVGAVGARLWFPDNTLQHGGVILGIHGWAAHAHNHFPRGSLGYKGRMALTQSFSAVTGACLLVRKSSYEAVGGLNEDALKISCNDVDFCLKLQKIGMRNVWTPFADLYHHESATRGFEDTPAKKARFAGELAYMQQHWAAELHNDPAYSRNLTLSAQDFGLAWPPRVAEGERPVQVQAGVAPLYERLASLGRLVGVSEGQHRIAYVAENIHSSTFRYRAANMAEVLNAPVVELVAGAVQTSAACFFSGDLYHAASIAQYADSLVVSRYRYDAKIADLIGLFKAQGKHVWFDIDDWVFDTSAIDLIVESQGQTATDEVLNYWYSVVGRMAQTLRLCDGAITTNAFLAGKLRQCIDGAVHVVPNFINAAQWQVSEPMYQRKLAAGFVQRERIKLGYFSGSASHNRDFALIAPALEVLLLSNPQAELVLVGHLDLEVALGEAVGARFRRQFEGQITQHGFTDYLTLQALIADVDFNLVPLQSNDFSHCKSELKYFDAAAVGTLSIASPTHAYAAAIRHGENGYLAADNDWLAVLQQALVLRGQHDQYAAMAQSAYHDVQTRYVWREQRMAILSALDLKHQNTISPLKP